MVVVDSSVWIDHFNGRDTPGTRGLTALLRDGEARLVVPDLVLFEVLRGFRHDEAHREASEALGALGVEVVGGAPLAHRAAQMYRNLRRLGITVRSPIDALLAAFCLQRGYALLHADRDFDAYATHHGLHCWRGVT
ncbi:type II toxin-antitoxin system VapC family toxin [Pseudorhodoferax sp.]|uniref:type II toxin-antitoxin system VapC family toxin n=1 Tax=Pseudorhodoferax sp. TaxID=1993553 RepID=UPI001B60E89B|nr:PIN domain-containing protein [Pseudorhodoferax sp.]MBP8145086.1 PIN domain-containing protein [Inhella sp.]